MQRYKRLATRPVDDIIKHIYVDSPKIDIDGHMVKTSTNRLLTYMSGTTCVRCGMKGEFFAVEENGSGPHLNLYGYKNGKEILITSDHIVPKANGGADTFNNRQCMCVICNMEKDCEMPASGGICNTRKAAMLWKNRTIRQLESEIHNLEVKLEAVNRRSLKKIENELKSKWGMI